MLGSNAAKHTRGGEVSERNEGVQLTDEQRIDWLRLIRSPNVGPRSRAAAIFPGATD